MSLVDKVRNLLLAGAAAVSLNCNLIFPYESQSRYSSDQGQIGFTDGQKDSKDGGLDGLVGDYQLSEGMIGDYTVVDGRKDYQVLDGNKDSIDNTYDSTVDFLAGDSTVDTLSTDSSLDSAVDSAPKLDTVIWPSKCINGWDCTESIVGPRKNCDAVCETATETIIISCKEMTQGFGSDCTTDSVPSVMPYTGCNACTAVAYNL